jgi:tryptophanyl-tRNA synthetase
MTKNKKVAFSGIKPSGEITIGNYLGAIQYWIELQKSYDCVYSVVDLHAITVPQNPKILNDRIYKVIAWYLALGIDPKKSIIYIQSHVPAHAELTWILNCLSHIGELERMTQFKDKSHKYGRDAITVGLFDYPVLMASDILLYNTDVVPVGEDQKQHVEFTRDLANRFNNKFGNIFKIPTPLLNKNTARIMGLDNPEKKMDKSSESEANYILLEDDSEKIRKKIARAVTDSKKDIVFDSTRKGLHNLLTIYQSFSGLTNSEIENKYTGKGYADFKKDLAEMIIDKLAPFQKKYNKLIDDRKYLLDITKEGDKVANLIAEKKLKEVKDKIGLI